MKIDLCQSTVIAFAVSCGTVLICGFIPWYYLIPLFCLFPFLHKRHQACAIAGFILAVCISLLNQAINVKTCADIPQRAMQISGTLRCVDKRSSRLAEFPPLKAVLCEIEGEDFSFTSPVFFPTEQRIFYGDTFTFTGNFFPPQSAGLLYADGKIHGTLPPLYGNRPTVEIKTFAATERKFSFLRKIFIVRDILLERLLSKIRTPAAAAMAAKLFFGAANAIPDEYNENFRNTGTIHLFSVSGLHVGLAAMFILILLALLPFRMRYYLAAAFTLFYVLLSGSSLSAVRAGCMVILWCILKANFFANAAWNALMYTWSLFLLISPETATSVSAQYSFGITAALMLLAEKLNQIFSVKTDFLEQFNLNSPHIVKAMLKLRWISKFIALLSAPVIAFATGCGISLFRQHIFAAGTIPANLLIVFISPLLFGTMFFKLIAGAVFPCCDEFGAFILEGTFNLLAEITAAVAKLFPHFTVGAPPLWSVVLFYIFLAVTLGVKEWKISAISLIGTVAIFLLWQTPSFQAPPYFAAISSDSSKPPLLAVIYPTGKTAYISDVPDGESGAVAAYLLKKEGISSATIYLSTPTDRSSRGLKRLAKNIDLNIHNPAGDKKLTRAFLRNINAAETELNKLPPPSGYSTGKDNSVTFPIFDLKISAKNTPSGREVELKSADGKIHTETLPWCSKPVLWIKPLR